MDRTKLSPFVKWVGGKGQLIEPIKQMIPRDYDTYYEPFVGGGAILFSLKPKKAVINDINKQLINVYEQIRDAPKEVIHTVNQLDSLPCDKDYYGECREIYNHKIQSEELSPECAAYMIWINKHCFNGLYRVNSRGSFNVPYNNKESVNSINEANIMNISKYLNEADIMILCSDFEDVCQRITSKDFVYFDSPYVPVSETASFTDYSKGGFKLEDHQRLASLYQRLSGLNIKALLSNNDVDLVRDLYGNYIIEHLNVRRNINSKANKRTGKEVIIRNYALNSFI